MPTVSGITLGQALSISTLSGGVASVAGSFAFTNPAAIPASAGNYSAAITFTPTDTANYTSVTGSVIVVVAPPANHAPVISGTPTGGITAGNAYSFTPAASDQDGNPLTFNITNKPPWATFSAVTGALTGTPVAGTYGNIQISVSDGNGGSATLPSFSIIVAAAPPPPGGGTPVPVMDGWWLVPGVLAGLGMFARRRKE
jgi:hypothetical protein